MEDEGYMAYEVILKPVDAVRVVSAREVVAEPEQMRERCLALMGAVEDAARTAGLSLGGRLSLALYHHNDQNGIDVEMALFVPEDTPVGAPARVQVYTLPPVPTMASAIYHGSYDDFAGVGAVYAALGRWVEVNGYEVTGPSRELYLHAPVLGTDNPSGVMEIQFPVRKRGRRLKSHALKNRRVGADSLSSDRSDRDVRQVNNCRRNDRSPTGTIPTRRRI
jgi:effector-binding domain-containing protein